MWRNFDIFCFQLLQQNCFPWFILILFLLHGGVGNLQKHCCYLLLKNLITSRQHQSNTLTKERDVVYVAVAVVISLLTISFGPNAMIGRPSCPCRFCPGTHCSSLEMVCYLLSLYVYVLNDIFWGGGFEGRPEGMGCQ